MRVVKLLVPPDTEDDVAEVLNDENIDYVVTDNVASGSNGSIVEFPIPTQAVGYVLDQLREAGVEDEKYTIITGAESAKTNNYKELESRFVAGVEEDDAVAREEIRAKSLGMHRSEFTYYSMTFFSAIVAAAGLLLDSPAIVVGAMVIAPQVGAALITSVGISLDDSHMIKLGLREQFFGLLGAILAALVLGLFLKHGQIVSAVLDVSTVGQIAKRISPGLLTVTVAVAAGAAGAFGLATALPVSLVGVMIAAALIPAAAAVGIGAAWGLSSVALGAFLLLVINAVAVNIAGAIVLWYFGYRPDDWEGDRFVGLFRRHRNATIAIVLLGTVFLTSGGLVADQIAYDNDVNTAVEDVIEEDRYDDLEVTLVQTEVELVQQVGRTPEVTVVVTRPDGEQYPEFASRLEGRISEETGRDVIVDVQFEEHQRSDPTQNGQSNGLRGEGTFDGRAVPA